MEPLDFIIYINYSILGFNTNFDSRKDLRTVEGFGLERLWPLAPGLPSLLRPASGTAFVALVLHTVISCSSLTQQLDKPHFVAYSQLKVHIAVCKPPVLLDFGLRTAPSTQRCSGHPRRLFATQERQPNDDHHLS